jgi:hypothetical protein
LAGGKAELASFSSAAPNIQQHHDVVVVWGGGAAGCDTNLVILRHAIYETKLKTH